jgi:adenine-specific DNA-methyltransferase
MAREESTRITLSYKRKQEATDIFSSVPPAKLHTVRTFQAQGLLADRAWTNILVFGDNLPVLKSYLGDNLVFGKVELIYIDPPFATKQEFRSGSSRVSTVSRSNSDQLAYSDQLIGCEYMEFLRRRLIFLHELLAKDGSIYLHIDWKMGHYARVVMDEIFGGKHFINDIARVKCNPKNFERPGYGNIKDMILFYSKGEHYVWDNPTEPFTEEDIERLFPKVEPGGKRYTTVPLHAPGETTNGPTGSTWKGLKPPKGRHWRTHPDELTKLDEAGLIEWSSTGNPRKKIYAAEVIMNGKKRQDIWEFKDPAYPTYPTEKNLEMLEMIIRASSRPDGLVLDCFAGSGTTLVAAERLGRRWIGIDHSPTAILATLKRLVGVPRARNFALCKVGSGPLPEAIEEFLHGDVPSSVSPVLF